MYTTLVLTKRVRIGYESHYNFVMAKSLSCFKASLYIEMAWKAKIICHFVHFKEHVLLHISIFYGILDLGFPINAPAHYRSPNFMYHFALKEILANIAFYLIIAILNVTTKTFILKLIYELLNEFKLCFSSESRSDILICLFWIFIWLVQFGYNIR